MGKSLVRCLLIGGLFVFSSFTDTKLYLNSEINTIHNFKALENFYNRLDSLVINDNSKVSIVHIGDSHIQGDYLTGQVRKRFQNNFGNAGRGFVFPYKIAKSGGAIDVRFNYTGNWNYCEIMRNYENCNVGAAGFSVSANIKCSFGLNVTSNSSFNKVKILDGKDTFSPNSVKGDFSIVQENNNTVVYFDRFQDSIGITPNFKENSSAELRGLVLENGQPGILYHAMGISGSSTLQYLRSSNFENEIADLNANLIIISFGTNDCYLPRSKFCSTCIKERYKTLITRLKSENPNASLLITIPPDHYYYRKYSNRNIKVLRDALLALAKEENVAVWDLYEVMGGENSIKKWQQANLAGRDLIHFTKEGYYKQGQLLYDALMHHYQER